MTQPEIAEVAEDVSLAKDAYETSAYEAELAGLTPWQRLYQRVTDALGSHDGTMEDQDLVRASFSRIDPDEGSEADMSREGMAALERLEALPRTGWDDQADVPDDTPDDF